MDLASTVIRDRRIAASEETRTRQRSRETGELGYIYGAGESSRARRSAAEGHGFDRTADQITTVVLHQTAGPRFFGSLIMSDDAAVESDHPIDRIAAHFVITDDGDAMYTHDVQYILSNAGGRSGIDIEVAGSFSSTQEPSGQRLSLAAIRTCRRLISDLVLAIPSISRIHPHGQVQRLPAGSDRHHGDKFDSCCGPDIWVNVGRWAVETLRLDCESTLGYPNHGISPRQTNEAYRQPI